MAFRGIKRRRDFTQAYREGVKVHGRLMVVFVRWREGGTGPRLGITATRRVGGAVVRNRCRRRVRAVAKWGEGLVGDLPLDVVVNVKKELAEAPWPEVVAEFVRCLEKGIARVGPRA
ncbi:MAG: ribonuclease P protein component [Acidobacteriota bacterium]